VMVEKIKSLRNFLKLSEKQQKAVMLLFSGEMTQAKIAEEVHVSATTLSTWKTHEDFRRGQDEYTRFMLHDLSSSAVLTMKELLNAKSEMVRYNAASYIIEKALSSVDEARKSKAEADIMEAKAKRETNGDGTDAVNVNIVIPDKEQDDDEQHHD
jgi:transcriptional regulator with XRE-family HTH domain